MKSQKAVLFGNSTSFARSSRGQLAAVLMIVILVAVVAGILLFSNKRAGMATALPPASYLPANCEDTRVKIDNPFCRSPQWGMVFQSELTKKCGTYCGNPSSGPICIPQLPNCKATKESYSGGVCIYKIDCK